MNKTKNAIFKSGVKIFSDYGYEGATLDAIALNAGLTKGTLYYHFKSKQEIFEYIVSVGIKMVKEEIEDAMDNEKAYISKLRELCRVQLSLVYKYKDLFKVIMGQIWAHKITNINFKRMINDYINYIDENFKEAIHKGELRNGDTSFMAYTFFGILCSGAVYELMNEKLEDVNEVIDNLITYTIEGIGKK